MIGERNLCQGRAVVVAIERAPSAVVVLHPDQPVQAGGNRPLHPCMIRIRDALERHQDERGVIDVGVEIVSEFESPAAWPEIRRGHLPITAADNLPLQEPPSGRD